NTYLYTYLLSQSSPNFPYTTLFRSRTEIIAWSALRELREFASHRLAGLNVKVLSATAAPGILRGAIERALRGGGDAARRAEPSLDRKSTRLNSSHLGISYAVFCLKK